MKDAQDHDKEEGEPEEAKGGAKAASKISIPLVRPYFILGASSALFGACAAFLFYRASTNDRGLIINGIIHFDAEGADIFYFVLGVLSALFVLMGGLAIFHCARIKDFRVLVGKKTIKLPPAVLWRGAEEITIAVDRITAISVQPPQKPAVIAIHEDALVHRIPVRWLPPAWTVQEVVELIRDRAQARQPRRAEPKSNLID